MTDPVLRLRADRTEDAFDRALASAARSLVVAPLPAAVLEAPRPIAARSRLRIEGTLAAAVAIVALTIGFAVGAPKAPGAGKSPAFRMEDDLSLDLRRSGYSCRPGADAPPGQPRMEALVCAVTKSRLVAAVIVSEDAAGQVGEIHIKSDIVGTPTVTAERDRSDLLKGLIGLPFADPTDTAAAHAWLTAGLPLDAGRRIGTTVDGVPVVLERAVNGGYLIVLGDLGIGPSAVPSR